MAKQNDASITFRTNQDFKDEFESVCEEMGLSMSSVFASFMVQVINQRKIPFEIKAKPKVMNDDELLKMSKMIIDENRVALEELAK